MASSDNSSFRKMTVLVQKLVGLEHGSVPERVGPVAIAGFLSEYLKLAMAQVNRHAGICCSVDNDGMTAYWMHEENHCDPLSACDCARSCLESVSSISAKCFPESAGDLQLHVGISVGQAILVPIENHGQLQYMPYGEVLKTAKSFCSRIPVGESGIVVGESIRELLGDHAVTGPPERIPCKGLDKPINAYRLKL